MVTKTITWFQVDLRKTFNISFAADIKTSVSEKRMFQKVTEMFLVRLYSRSNFQRSIIPRIFTLFSAKLQHSSFFFLLAYIWGCKMYGDVSPITWQLYIINKNHQTKKKKQEKKHSRCLSKIVSLNVFFSKRDKWIRGRFIVDIIQWHFTRLQPNTD